MLAGLGDACSDACGDPSLPSYAGCVSQCQTIASGQASTPAQDFETCTDACTDPTCYGQCVIAYQNAISGTAQIVSAIVGIWGGSSAQDPYGQCLDSCPSPGPSDPNGTIYGQCIHMCSLTKGQGRYGGVETTTSLPSGITPTTFANLPSSAALPLCSSVSPGTPCFNPSPAPNWWVIGGAAVLGLLGVGVFLARRRGIAHAT